MRHLLLDLQAPLMAFGGETIDNYGVVRDFPAASMLTGLLANALGWRRIERELHQRLQDRLVFAARIDREPAGGVHLTDYQTVRIGEGTDLFRTTDRKDGRRKYVVGWTTRGTPDFRGGDLGDHGFTHERWRDYFADMRVTVALRLEPAADPPTLDDLAAALKEPKRPLFIGRKPCLPSGRLFRCIREGNTALAALMDIPIKEPIEQLRRSDDELVRLLWPAGEDAAADAAANRTYQLTDERNWVSGLHGGGRAVCEGTRPVAAFLSAEASEEAQP